MQNYAYSDSQVVLLWLPKPPDDIFVLNHVRKIKAVVNPTQWAYVMTSDNPPDLPSYGVTVNTLIHSSL